MNTNILKNVARALSGAVAAIKDALSSADEKDNAVLALKAARKNYTAGVAKAKTAVRSLKEATGKDEADRKAVRAALVKQLIGSGYAKQRVAEILVAAGWPSGKKTPEKRWQPIEGALEALDSTLMAFYTDAADQTRLLRVALNARKNSK